MKKIILIAIILVVSTLSSRAQITLEHKHDSASDYLNHELIVVKFELLGDCYVKINRHGRSISIYDLNHSLINSISLASYPQGGNYLFMLLYISQQLFDPDPAIEFMYGYIDANGTPHTRIYKENGTLLFVADSLYCWDEINIPQQQFPIYNTTQGTKMILSHYTNGQSYVYSLPGTLTTAIDRASHSFAGNMGSAYPNPTNQSTTVDYKLPDNTNQGEIVFYNLQGTEIKRYKVDRTFDHLLISTADIPTGTYYYQLQTSGNASTSKKLVVIK
jgi:hypothetical protein